MKLRFLGTGTSAGVPCLGCDCAVCRSADPRDTRLRTSGLIGFDDPDGQPRTVLIDAGPDLRQQALAADVPRLDSILFTHNHVDHTFGLDEVRRYNIVQRGAIDIHADAPTLHTLRRVYRHIFEPERNVQASFVATLRASEIPGPPFEPMNLFGLRCTPFQLMHGRLPVLGFRFDAAHPSLDREWLPMAWCTDVNEIPDASRPVLEGLSTLVLDALRVKPHPTHFTFDEARDAANEIGAKQTWFIHISHDESHEQLERRFDALPMRPAWDGLELT